MGDRRAEFMDECKALLEGLKSVGGVDVHSVDTNMRSDGPVVAAVYFLECFDDRGRRMVPRPSTAKINAGEWRQVALHIAATTKEIAKASDLAKLARDKLKAVVDRAMQDREFFG